MRSTPTRRKIVFTKARTCVKIRVDFSPCFCKNDLPSCGVNSVQKGAALVSLKFFFHLCVSASPFHSAHSKGVMRAQVEVNGVLKIEQYLWGSGASPILYIVSFASKRHPQARFVPLSCFLVVNTQTPENMRLRKNSWKHSLSSLRKFI